MVRKLRIHKYRELKKAHASKKREIIALRNAASKTDERIQALMGKGVMVKGAAARYDEAQKLANENKTTKEQITRLEAAYLSLDNLIHHIEKNLDIFLGELRHRERDRFAGPLSRKSYPGYDRTFMHVIDDLNKKMAQVLESEIKGVDDEIGNLRRELQTLDGR